MTPFRPCRTVGGVACEKNVQETCRGRGIDDGPLKLPKSLYPTHEGSVVSRNCHRPNGGEGGRGRDLRRGGPRRSEYRPVSVLSTPPRRPHRARQGHWTSGPFNKTAGPGRNPSGDSCGPWGPGGTEQKTRTGPPQHQSDHVGGGPSGAETREGE